MAARKRQSPISTIDYTFSGVDWSALPPESLQGFNPPTDVPAVVPTGTMTPAEAEAAAAIALGQPTGRPAVGLDQPTGEPGDQGAEPIGEPSPVEEVTPPAAIPAEPPAAAPPVPTPVTPPPAAGPSQSAIDYLNSVLSDYFSGDDLEALKKVAWTFLTENTQYSDDQFLRSIRGTTQYQTRFAGNKKRLEAGLPELTPAEYIGLENTYRNTMQFYNIPKEFYDETSDFQKLIEGNVDPTELNQRVARGYAAVKQASPDVIQQMKTLYGVEESELAAYFLDPTRATTILTRRAEAAQTAAAARQGGIQLQATLAETLAAENISPERIRQGAATVTQQAQVRQALQAGEETISEEEALQAEFGLSEAAAQRIRQRQRRRIAEFEAGGGFAQTQTGITGLRTVGQ